MPGFTNLLENEVLDHIFPDQAFVPPSTLHIALSTTAPADDGTNITEPVGDGYARVAIVSNLTNWPAASGGSINNGVAVVFPQATGTWGTITHFVVYDAASGGNALVIGVLAASKLIDNNDQATFDIGTMVFTID